MPRTKRFVGHKGGVGWGLFYDWWRHQGPPLPNLPMWSISAHDSQVTTKLFISWPISLNTLVLSRARPYPLHALLLRRWKATKSDGWNSFKMSRLRVSTWLLPLWCECGKVWVVVILLCEKNETGNWAGWGPCSSEVQILDLALMLAFFLIYSSSNWRPIS